ncbi:MAG TPA: hypothetical protein VGB68_15970 [Pyrinomonadaceae bacterium]|jgi:hypothetical protein
MKKKTKYRKGKFPYTVLNTENGKLYVRKSVTLKGKQHQIWRVCEPPISERAAEILEEIRLEVQAENSLIGYSKKDAELARVFMQVRDKEIGFFHFKQKVAIKK